MDKIYLPPDYSGVSPYNLIRDEVHTLQLNNSQDYYIIIPKLAPIYKNNLKVVHVKNYEKIELSLHNEYELVMPIVSSQLFTAHKLYCGIVINNRTLDGIIEITYQSFGGNFSSLRDRVLQIVADKAFNPRQANWNFIINKPEFFIPSQHFNYFKEVYGEDEHVLRLQGIAQAILNRSEELKLIVSSSLNTSSQADYDNLFVNKLTPYVGGNLTTTGDNSPDNAAIYQYLINIINIIQTDINTIQIVLNDKLNKENDTILDKLFINATPVLNNHAATIGYINNLLQSLTVSVDTGTILLLPTQIANTVNNDYLSANGAYININDYINLFNVIGHTFEDYNNFIYNTYDRNLYMISQPVNNITSNISVSSFVVN